MKQAFYRNYRPRSFKDLVGQDHVTKTLGQAVKSGRINHAYLFTGPRGVGKTSAARILAHEVNGLAYKGESSHLDIIEIDAASNRRIDEIRDLREKVRIAPTSGKYKVYIVDEVHMLTREAFNALLKTLEEPPSHIIFILATTEAHKLPETIISRTQRFEFKPVPLDKIAKQLKMIAKSEKIDISAQSLNLLAEFGKGSFRDSIGLLDLLSSSGHSISEDDVQKMLGIPPNNLIEDILNQIISKNPKSTLLSVQQLKEQGIDPSIAASAIAKQIRNKIVEGSASRNLVSVLKQLVEIPASAQPYDYLEIVLLEASSGFTEASSAELKKPQPAKTAQAMISSTKTIDRPAAAKITSFDVSIWPEIVEGARQRAASIYTALKLAKPELQDGTLVLKFEYPLHQRKIDQAKSKALVSELIESTSGHRVQLECVVDKAAFAEFSPRQKTSPHQPKSQLHSINSIFGAAEVMEV